MVSQVSLTNSWRVFPSQIFCAFELRERVQPHLLQFAFSNQGLINQLHDVDFFFFSIGATRIVRGKQDMLSYVYMNVVDGFEPY